MSKQDSQHIADKQVTKAKSNFKKKKEFEVWERYSRKWRKAHWKYGKNHGYYWQKIGNYATKEVAENVIERRKLVLYMLANYYIYKIVGPGEERPEPRK